MRELHPMTTSALRAARIPRHGWCEGTPTKRSSSSTREIQPGTQARRALIKSRSLYSVREAPPSLINRYNPPSSVVINKQDKKSEGSGFCGTRPRRRSCGVAINTLVDLNKLAGEFPSFCRAYVTAGYRSDPNNSALRCYRIFPYLSDCLICFGRGSGKRDVLPVQWFNAGGYDGTLIRI